LIWGLSYHVMAAIMSMCEVVAMMTGVTDISASSAFAVLAKSKDGKKIEGCLLGWGPERIKD
jgi:hypothetical protein